MMVIEAHLIPTNIIATALIFINLAHCESAKNNVDKQNSRHCRECIIVHWRVAGDRVEGPLTANRCNIASSWEHNTRPTIVTKKLATCNTKDGSK